VGEFEGAGVLVTGGTTGLGRAIAASFRAEGAAVVITGRDERLGSAAADALGAAFVRADASEADEVSASVVAAVDALGRLDVLVNNAGISNDEGQRGIDADLDRVREALEANLLGAWRLCEVAIPLMQRNGYGRIVNISTGLAALEDMGGGSPAYRVSKTALNALTRILASELRGSGILVNSVCPGWVQTDMGGSRAPRPVEEGADTPVWAATLPNNGPTGGFFRDRRPIHW
jgi:NAD(P)-dependent dehydrogenase (short-subunit alcohol dehydrogenase family)